MRCNIVDKDCHTFDGNCHTNAIRLQHRRTTFASENKKVKLNYDEKKEQRQVHQHVGNGNSTDACHHRTGTNRKEQRCCQRHYSHRQHHHQREGAGRSEGNRNDKAQHQYRRYEEIVNERYEFFDKNKLNGSFIDYFRKHAAKK